MDHDDAIRQQVSGPRSAHQHGEIGVSTDSENSLPGSSLRLYFGTGVRSTGSYSSYPKQNQGDIRVCAAPTVEGRVTSRLTSVSRESSIARSTEPQRFSVLCEPSNQAGAHVISSSDDDASSLDGLEVVEHDAKSSSGPIVCVSSPDTGSPVRRVDDRVGLCHLRQGFSGALVSSGATPSHKRARAPSDSDSLPDLPAAVEEQSSKLSSRQFYGCLAHQSPRRDEIPIDDGRDTPGFPRVVFTKHNSGSKPHSGRIKRLGRLSLAPKTGHSHGMASKRRRFPVDRRRVSLGSPRGRLVRQQAQSPAKLLHVALPRQISSSDRRAESRLAQEQSAVCLPTRNHTGSCHSQAADNTTSTSAISSPVSNQRNLVPQSTQHDDKGAYTAADVARHVTATTLESHSSGSDNDEIAPMVGKNAWLKAQGFSERVTARMETARAVSTNAVYNSKWKLFAYYCKDRGIRPWSANGPVIAEFLTWLFEERKASVRTLRGYRSALGAALRNATGYDPGADEVLSQLMRGFLRTRPIKSRALVTWDISLVLRYLKSGKLSTTGRLSPKDLTLKLVFLLALATGKRRSELHALDQDVRLVNNEWKEVVLRPRPDFLGKTHFATGGAGTFSEIVLKSIDSAEGYTLPEKSLCPVTTLRIYQRVSREYRSEAQERLIISYMQGKTDDIKKQTISNYLKLVVQQAYLASASDESVCQDFNMSPHDLRGIATSLKASKNVTMAEILHSGVWASANTFITHYVKKFTCDELSNLCRLGPFVAAGTTIVE